MADELCATGPQLEACQNVPDGGTCSVGGGVGRCDRGVCTAAGCGNGILDAGEACDDGNQTSGDGCRADCRKLEICGDGVVDDVEGCDDGNLNAADGCDACMPTWWRATAVIGGNANATAIGLTEPSAIAADRRGNVYVVNSLDHRVRRIDATSGIITTVAGTGEAGFSGDGGVATSAQLNRPQGVAVDGLGTLYIADSLNHRVRRVDAATGVITTIAGNGTPGGTGDGGAAASAQLNRPGGVTVDGLGTLYIADSYNHRIRRVNATTGVITGVAGTGAQGFSGDGGAATSARLYFPAGLALDDDQGIIYIADTFNHRIRRVDGTGIISTAAGTGTAGSSGDGGLAVSAELYFPRAVALDAADRIYIADHFNHRIRRIDMAGIIATVAGTGSIGFGGDGGPATTAQLAHPSGVAIDGAGRLYIGDTANNRVRRVDSGTIVTIAGTPTGGIASDGGAATSAQILLMTDVAVGPLGALYLTDVARARIRRVDGATGIITTAAGGGTALGDGGAATSALLAGSTGIAIDGDGNLYLADANDHRVRRVDALTGIITTVAGNGTQGFSGDDGAATSAQLWYPYDVAVDAIGTLYIADQLSARIRRVDATTGIITTFAGNGVEGFAGDGGPATSAQLQSPHGLAVDRLGHLYIADTYNHRIRRVDAISGVITTVAGTGSAGSSGDGGAATAAQLRFPESVVLDGAGTLFIADTSNHRIRRVDATTGVITTVAGTGIGGSSGDGGAVTSADLQNPEGVALDGLGSLYIVDVTNDRLRRVDASSGVVTTVAGAIDPEGMGASPQARLADPRGLVVAPAFTLIAGGSSGTVQAIRSGTIEVVAGRYPQQTATAALARFRDASFGTVSGVAFDAAAGLVYLSESTAHRIHVVTVVDPTDARTWTIAPLANTTGTAGFADGAAATARFRGPGGLHLDSATRTLYVADAGNHTIRAIDLSAGPTNATVRTVAGTPATRGFFGDGGAAQGALLYAPQAITRCANGDLFVADTGNHRVRRIAAATQTITTVIGVGVAASSGEGTPASTFPVHAPLGLACDAAGNLLVSSTTTVRLLPADASGVVDGAGSVQTIYGSPPRDQFPASVTRCLSGLQVTSETTALVADSCTGLLLELRRETL